MYKKKVLNDHKEMFPDVHKSLIIINIWYTTNIDGNTT